jgi:hypothetical protein
MIFYGKIFLIAEIYFRIFFLQNKFISETYFLAIKRFWKAANTSGDLNMIFFAAFRNLSVFLEIGFQNSFKTTAAAF